MTEHTDYFMTCVEIKDYNGMIDGRNLFNQPLKNNMKTYNNILKTTTGQVHNYTTCCLLFYHYFNEHYKMIAIDLNEQKKLDSDPKAIHQINFTANLDQTGETVMYFITEEAKETILNFS